MIYQVNVLHPKAAVLLYDLAELGLISIEEEKNESSETEECLEKESSTVGNGADKSGKAKARWEGYDDLPPITKSLAGSLEAPDGRIIRRRSAIAQEKNYDDRDDIPPIVRSMLGAFEASEDFDYKEELTKALAKKYP